MRPSAWDENRGEANWSGSPKGGDRRRASRGIAYRAPVGGWPHSGGTTSLSVALNTARAPETLSPTLAEEGP